MTAFRWGDPAAAISLPPAIRGLLGSALGVTAPRPVTPVVLPPPAPLPAALAADTSDQARLAHAAGMSTEDLLRARRGEAPGAPDGVVRPASHDEVLDVLRVAAAQRVAVVPFGGGTSVVGGLRPVRDGFRAVVALDLAGLDRLVAVDPVSRTATFEAGVRGPRAEELLAAHGFTLGHFPQSFQYATLGGFAATRSSGQASAGYGRFDQMVVALRAATPAGSLDLGRAPHSAAGPDLRQLLIGSEGTFGIITRVRVRVHPIPAATRYEAWSFPDFATGADALRAVVQTGTGPTVVRLSDEAETGVNLATTENIGEQQITGGCLAITAFEGTEAHVESRHTETRALLEASGGTSLGEGPALAWEHGRFNAPYLRDSLLSAGALCETLETATNWSNLATLKAAVTDALTGALADSGTPALVLCHISHVYPTGASLYFTVVAAQRGNPIEQWRKAKAAASDAMIRVGATITHHHAVGADHRPWMRDEIGDVGVQVLRAVKATLDPAGILNPGKLIP